MTVTSYVSPLDRSKVYTNSLFLTEYDAWTAYVNLYNKDFTFTLWPQTLCGAVVQVWEQILSDIQQRIEY